MLKQEPPTATLARTVPQEPMLLLEVVPLCPVACLVKLANTAQPLDPTRRLLVPCVWQASFQWWKVHNLLLFAPTAVSAHTIQSAVPIHLCSAWLVHSTLTALLVRLAFPSA